jgi:hypothetical protein
MSLRMSMRFSAVEFGDDHPDGDVLFAECCHEIGVAGQPADLAICPLTACVRFGAPDLIA